MIESWESLVVTELCNLKRLGWTFNSAWDAATAKHRPRLRDRMDSDRLFEMDDTGNAVESTQTLAEFFHGSCDDAWHGRKPKLRGLCQALEGGFGDQARLARARTSEHGARRARMAA